ncbi:MAG: hypothetical protein AB7I13_00330 [Vicinamibacterales bacterium]
MASKRDGIVAAAVTALGVASVGGTTKPTGLTVHRQRKRPLSQDQLPAIVLWQSIEPRDYDATDKVDRVLNLHVECRVRHEGTSGDEALDPLLVWAEKVLMADITLGGRCAEILAQETSWDLDDPDAPIARAAIRFEVKYQTKNNDPEN